MLLSVAKDSPARMSFLFCPTFDSHCFCVRLSPSVTNALLCLHIACRDEALQVVLDFSSNAGLVHLARLLYQLEVLLLQSGNTSMKVGQTLHVCRNSYPASSGAAAATAATMSCRLLPM